jgi:magnesium and cobalt transporter
VSDATSETPSQGSSAGILSRLRRMWRPETSEAETVREAIEDLIEERAEENPNVATEPIDPHERLLIGNVLKLRDVVVRDIMVPRADIIAIDADTPLLEVFRISLKEGHSRYPVFRGTLDDVIGMIHIKDLAQSLPGGSSSIAFEGAEDAAPVPKLGDLIRKVLFVSPAIRVLDLLLEMRLKRTHMALVVDEFGGIDGLVTIENVVEQIVGEIEDEHDSDKEPELVEQADGSVLADGRLTLAAFEARFGAVFSDEDREETDTMSGLVARLAGRVPARNELIKHASGIEFEILDGDPRRVHRLRITQLPKPARERAPDLA